MSAVGSLSKDKYTIKANSTQTISFMGASPNHYYIVNGGNTPLYVGISMMPTENFYDAKIPSASSKLCADAHGHHEIYIYNPSISDANIIITSFKADFEAETLALVGIGQDMTMLELSGEVDAKGDLKTLLSSIKNNTVNYSEAINNKNKCAVYAKDMTVSPSSIFISYCEDNRIVTAVDFLSNDGENDIVLGICNILDNPDEYWTTITIKPNEVINNLNTYASAIKLTCDNTSGSKIRLVFREGIK